MSNARRSHHQLAQKRASADDDDVPSVGGISSITQSANVSVDGSSDGDLAIRPMRGGAISPATARQAPVRVLVGPSRSENILNMLTRYNRISILNFAEILRACNIKCDHNAVDDLWLSVVGPSGATYADPQQVCRVIVENGGAYVGDSKPFSSVTTTAGFSSATLLAPTAASSAKNRAPSPVAGPIRSRTPRRNTSPMYFGIPASAALHPHMHRTHEEHIHSLESSRNRSISADKRRKLSAAEINAVSGRLYGHADQLRKKYEQERTRIVEEREATTNAECTGKPKINVSSLLRVSLAQRPAAAYARDTESSIWKLKRTVSPAREETIPPPTFPSRGRSRTPPPDRSVEIKGFYESVTRMRQASPHRSTSPKCVFEESLRGYSSPLSHALENRPPSTFGQERTVTPRPKLVPGASLLQEVERQTRFIETTLRSKEPLVVDRFDNESTPLFDNDSLSFHPATQSSRRLLDEKIKLGEISFRDAAAIRESLQQVTTASLVSRFEFDKTHAGGQGSYDATYRQRQASVSPRKRYLSPTKSVVLSRRPVAP